MITIIKDTREQKGWDRDFFGPEFALESGTLKTGDYTIKGMQKIVCVERKADWAELMFNLSAKARKERLYREFERMMDYKVRVLIVEENISDLFRKRDYYNPNHVITAINAMAKIVGEHGIAFLPVGKRIRSKFVVQTLFRWLAQNKRKL